MSDEQPSMDEQVSAYIEKMQTLAADVPPMHVYYDHVDGEWFPYVTGSDGLPHYLGRHPFSEPDEKTF